MMANSKYKRTLKKKLNGELHAAMNNLRRENANLKKTLAELTLQHSQHYKLVEGFLSLETLKLESSQQAVDEQPCEKEGESEDAVSMRSKKKISSYSTEIEELKSRIVSISARCQYLQNKIAKKKDFSSDEQGSTLDEDVTELKVSLRDALEKNKQWLEYDQEREAYVRAILDRMLWLEMQLNEANQACAQQHKEEHSDEKEKISQMQEYYERLLQKAKEELKVLREQVDQTNQELIVTQNWFKKKQREIEELQRELESERKSRIVPVETDRSEDEEQLSDDSRDLQSSLDKEKRRSANAELQSSVFQKFMLNHQFADQKKIEDLQRQETDEQCSSSCDTTYSITKLSRTNLTSTQGDLLNESVLECPNCQAEYQASHYRELMVHIDVCLT